MTGFLAIALLGGCPEPPPPALPRYRDPPLGEELAPADLADDVHPTEREHLRLLCEAPPRHLALFDLGPWLVAEVRQDEEVARFHVRRLSRQTVQTAAPHPQRPFLVVEGLPDEVAWITLEDAPDLLPTSARAEVDELRLWLPSCPLAEVDHDWLQELP